jgi:DNA-binding CsgD family transcriptional regulator
MWAGRAREAADRLARESERIAPIDGGRAASLLRDAAFAAASADEWERAQILGERALRASAGASDGNGLAQTALDSILVRRAQGAGREPDWEQLADASRDLALAPLVLHIAHWCAWRPGAQPKALAIVESVIERARERHALGVLPEALLMHGHEQLEVGDWPNAFADYAEALELALDASQPLVAATALTFMARIEAFQGKESACREHARRARALAEGANAPKRASYVGVILGELELGLGRPEAAIAELEPAVADLLPAISRAQRDVVEAYLLAGRREDAEIRARELEEHVEATGRGEASRYHVRGLLAADDDFEREFAAALEPDQYTFERARTELVFGERLRRVKRRSEARVHLRAALERFEELGAEPWAERARRELEATGERVRRGEEAHSDELTPAELRVAQLVAAGATNKEAAARLFVSPNTIEFHLKNVYRKLDVRSRSELAGRFAGS